MEEIDLKELFEFFKSKIGLIIAIVAGVCVLGCLYGFFIQKPMYQSYTTVILGSSANTSNSITQNDINLNKNLVSTYAQIVKSKRVLEQVISQLDLDIKYEELAKMYNMKVEDVRKALEPNQNEVLKNLRNEMFTKFVLANNE